MKKLATQTLATLVIIGVMSMSTVNAASRERARLGGLNHLKDLEKVYAHHDRKFELRASVLGIDPDSLREQLREKPLETIVKKYGFKNSMSFYTAVTGKLKVELRQRGWSEKRLEQFVARRVERVSSSLTPMSLSAV